MFQILNWKRVVILKKDNHLVDHTLFPRYSIQLLAVLSKKEEELTYNETYKVVI